MGTRLQGKVAVVTGAGRGMGRAIAGLLAAEGAAVVVNDVGAGGGNAERIAERTANDIRAQGGTAVSNGSDVSSWAAAERLIEQAVGEFSRIDILVNGASVWREQALFDVNEQDWQAVVAAQLKGAFNCSRHACVRMRQQRSGHIINVSSTAGLYGGAGRASYAAAKDGLAGLTRVVSREMGKYGVTVNCVAAADTSMPAAGSGPQRAALRSGSEPEDIAPFAVYLTTDAAANINGQTFLVNGGMIAHLGDPAPVRTIQKHGRWSPREIASVFAVTLGKDLVNPAPAAS